MSTRIISRAEGGIVPEPVGRSPMPRPSPWLLCHYTGSSGPFVGDGLSDAQHFTALHAGAVNAGKPYEYNYAITAPLGWIWEWAGDVQGAHCLNANGFAYGVQMNLGVGDPPNAAMVESFVWLHDHLVDTGQLATQHKIGPHYNMRQTACCGTVMAEPPDGGWSSPTGQGSLGNLLPYLLALPPEPNMPLDANDKAYLDAKFAATQSDIAALHNQLIDMQIYAEAAQAQVVGAVAQTQGAVEGMSEDIAALQGTVDALTATLVAAIEDALTDVTVTVDNEAVATATADKFAARLVS
jgi:hypothetical protein